MGSPHEILINDGTGRFLAKADSGLEGEWNTIAGNALLADFNGDANLDLYIGNGHTTSAAPDSYWLGNGDGSFQKATSALQGTLLHPSNGLVACDYDADGDLDIFVSTYGVSQAKGHNILWENNGDGTFQNVAAKGFSRPGVEIPSCRKPTLEPHPKASRSINGWEATGLDWPARISTG